ncbi:hypothetical protein BS17DRAFT_669495, partial [Gyrodon lividus]
GRVVCVVLVAVVCNKPAAHKIGGFRLHSHMYFCTICWITTESNPWLFPNCSPAFPPCTNAEQRKQGLEYCMVTGPTTCKNFVKLHVTWFTQLSWQPYFNLVNQVVFNPMHNFSQYITTMYLCVVKSHIYNIWVQGKILHTNHELKVLHEML